MLAFVSMEEYMLDGLVVEHLLRPRINGRVRIPDSVALVPLTAWK